MCVIKVNRAFVFLFHETNIQLYFKVFATLQYLKYICIMKERISTFARKLGYSHTSVRNWIKEGLLDAESEYGMTFVILNEKSEKLIKLKKRINL